MVDSKSVKFCTITISRKYAGGGDDLAAKLSTELGWVLFDRQVMHDAAEHTGLTEREMKAFDEPYFDNFNVALYRFTVAAHKRPVIRIDEKGKIHAGPSRFDDKDYFDIVNKFIKELHVKKNAIIVGRGSQCILADQPDVLHIRVESSKEYRSKRIQESLEISESRAEKIIKELDERQANFLKHFFNITGNESRLYHIILNSSKLGMDKMVEIVKSLLCEKTSDKRE